MPGNIGLGSFNTFNLPKAQPIILLLLHVWEELTTITTLRHTKPHLTVNKPRKKTAPQY